MSDIQIDQEFFSAARRGLSKLSTTDQSELKRAVEAAIQESGAFQNRNAEDDIYMTSFGIQLATLLNIDKNSSQTTTYLQSKKSGEGLDFLHVVSLARCWRFYAHDSLEIGNYAKVAEKIDYNRCVDGGWNQASGTHFSSTYGTFLALAAYQDLDQSIAEEMKLIKALKGIRSDDGAFGTDHGATNGTTPATAFAVMVLSYLEEKADFDVSWLLKQQHTDGGFRAVSQMPFSDIQSTAYALMALHLAAPDQAKTITPDVKRFLLSMHRPDGFLGHCKDDQVDWENTFLALAALGLTD